jgi:O-acetyl-ADP-ribose deacetylase (regulator of RNase III)
MFNLQALLDSISTLQVGSPNGKVLPVIHYTNISPSSAYHRYDKNRHSGGRRKFDKPKVMTVQGDLMAAPETFLLHGCNAQGVMGRGVAKLVRDAYPEAYRVYRDAYEARQDKTRGLPLGSYTIWEGDERTVINGITQEFFQGGDADHVYVSYAAVERLFQSLNEEDKVYGKSIAVPRIGAGLARGNWEAIHEIIAETVSNYYVTIYMQD